MKKMSLFILTNILILTAYAHSFGLDDAKKAKVTAEITTVLSKDGTSEKFTKCISTKDSSVYPIITNKKKMSNLKDMPLKDLEKINKVVQACKLA